MRAYEGQLNVGYGGLSRLRHDAQQFACLCEILPASGIGEKPVVANAMEATGQDVQQEAAHELVGAERHGLVTRLPRGTVILPAKGDAALVEYQQALVRDRHAVGIARQVGEHGCRPGKRALGIDDPFARSQWCEPVGESPRVGKRGVLAEELQSAATMSLIELFEETATE